MAYSWVFCYITSGLSVLVALKHQKYANGLYYCYTVFSKRSLRLAYEFYPVVAFIAVPLFIQSAAYFNIMRVLRVKIQAQPGNNLPNTANSYQIMRRIKQKRRLINMLLIMTVAFQICYIPRGAIMLIQEFSPTLTPTVQFRYIDLVSMVLYYMKRIINPINLCAMSSDFRQAFRSFFEIFNIIFRGEYNKNSAL